MSLELITTSQRSPLLPHLILTPEMLIEAGHIQLSISAFNSLVFIGMTWCTSVAKINTSCFLTSSVWCLHISVTGTMLTTCKSSCSLLIQPRRVQVCTSLSLIKVDLLVLMEENVISNFSVSRTDEKP